MTCGFHRSCPAARGWSRYSPCQPIQPIAQIVRRSATLIPGGYPRPQPGMVFGYILIGWLRLTARPETSDTFLGSYALACSAKKRKKTNIIQ